jgi:hypothetical protein
MCQARLTRCQLRLGCSAIQALLVPAALVADSGSALLLLLLGRRGGWRRACGRSRLGRPLS